MVEGHVVRIDKDEILVDIGAKSEGVVSNRELYGRNAESSPALNVGDIVLVYVLQPESQEGHVVLSLRRAGLERKWRAMQEQFEAGLIIEAPVIDHNKGGLIVDCGIRGFVPISQIVDFPRRPQNDQPRDAAQEIAEKLQPFVGRKLRLKILEVNRKANRLILSEKVALYEERREKRDELFSSLQVGQKVTGTVRSIAPFGVFIDLGGIDGLVHKSELSWNKVNNPEAGYKVGEEVEAEVIDINHERGRISLSIRRLQPDPWHSTVADYKVGDLIEGTVTKLVNFGAFVRVRDGLEGLIHISELSHQRVAHPGDVVHEGQTLKLKIISLDSERHRLGLSLKQAEEPPARPEPVVAAAPRPERAERSRPRPERGYSLSDAVQEPEGGIDNTLAAAFAQVREQVAASEKAAGDDRRRRDRGRRGRGSRGIRREGRSAQGSGGSRRRDRGRRGGGDPGDGRGRTRSQGHQGPGGRGRDRRGPGGRRPRGDQGGRHRGRGSEGGGSQGRREGRRGRARGQGACQGRGSEGGRQGRREGRDQGRREDRGQGRRQGGRTEGRGRQGRTGQGRDAQGRPGGRRRDPGPGRRPGRRRLTIAARPTARAVLPTSRGCTGTVA